MVRTTVLPHFFCFCDFLTLDFSHTISNEEILTFLNREDGCGSAVRRDGRTRTSKSKANKAKLYNVFLAPEVHYLSILAYIMERNEAGLFQNSKVKKAW